MPDVNVVGASARQRGSATTHVSSLIEDYFEEQLAHATESGPIGYYARILTQTTLPHSKPQEPVFERQNGNVSVSMSAPPSIGLPYGSVPRILLAWITTEAVRTKDRHLVLGDHLSAFMRELELVPTGGKWGTITRLRNQMERLFSTSIRVNYQGDGVSGGMGWMMTDQYELWWNPKRPEDGTLWESTVTLGENFFREITEHPIPVRMDALHQLRKSPLALDLYAWLTYRMSYLQKITTIPWEALHAQFGSDYARIDHFREEARRALHSVAYVYPAIRVDASSPVSVKLSPGPTHVARIGRG